VLFADPELGEGGLYVGVFAAIAGLAHEVGPRGLRLDEILAIWDDNTNVQGETLVSAVEKLRVLGYLVARQWIRSTHEVRWFVGAGLVMPHVSDGPCDVCST
jgi:hypothetical protein